MESREIAAGTKEHPGSNTLVTETPEDVLRAEADIASPEARIPLSVTVRGDVSVRWQDFRAARTTEARLAFIKAQKQILSPLQTEVIDWLRKHDASQIEPRWASNSVYAELPAMHVRALFSHPDVVGASGSHLFEQTAVWDGDQSSTATRVSAMYGAGVVGAAGSRIGTHGAIRIAVVDADSVPIDHVGIDSRVMVRKDCRAIGLPPGCYSVSAASGNNHATMVSWTAAGSIEAGQDSNFPGTNTYAQRQRSGHNKGALVYAYIGNTGGAMTRAVQQAMSDGVDIINIS